MLLVELFGSSEVSTDVGVFPQESVQDLGKVMGKVMRSLLE